jgi:hypothetical protein
MANSKLKKILENLKKLGVPFKKASQIIRGFDGAGKLRNEYADMIGEADANPKPTHKTVELSTNMKTWNARGHPRVKPSSDAITISFPKRGYASAGGSNIKCTPDGIEKSREVELSYSIFIPRDFDFKKGGKIGIGFNINDGTGGKTWRENDGSFRLMWRSGGQAVAYLYLPMDQGRYIPGKVNCPLLKNQGGEFMNAISNKTPSAGLDLFRYTPKKLYFKRGAWNTIVMSASLNDVGRNNGTLSLSVNGDVMRVTDMTWTANPDGNQFTQIQLANWFGGGDASWAASKDEEIKINNVKYIFSV